MYKKSWNQTLFSNIQTVTIRNEKFWLTMIIKYKHNYVIMSQIVNFSIVSYSSTYFPKNMLKNTCTAKAHHH